MAPCGTLVHGCVTSKVRLFMRTSGAAPRASVANAVASARSSMLRGWTSCSISAQPWPMTPPSDELKCRRYVLFGIRKTGFLASKRPSRLPPQTALPHTSHTAPFGETDIPGPSLAAQSNCEPRGAAGCSMLFSWPVNQRTSKRRPLAHDEPASAGDQSRAPFDLFDTRPVPCAKEGDLRLPCDALSFPLVPLPSATFPSAPTACFLRVGARPQLLVARGAVAHGLCFEAFDLVLELQDVARMEPAAVAKPQAHADVVAPCTCHAHPATRGLRRVPRHVFYCAQRKGALVVHLAVHSGLDFRHAIVAGACAIRGYMYNHNEQGHSSGHCQARGVF
eukprot:scaffold5824_cov73-Phaeocystis_antarctica.AAC.2